MSVEIVPLEIPEVMLIKPDIYFDHRGFFSETWNRKDFSDAGIDVDFIQDNHSLSCDAGTVRGLHFQLPPFAQNKLVRVVRGSVLDVAVDIRKASPTFGKYVTQLLNAENWHALFIPIGFAHGFCTLEPGTEVIYKVDSSYSPSHDRGISWNDPSIGINWDIDENKVILSNKDRQLPSLQNYRKQIPF